MSIDKSIINLEDLSKPAVVLIEKISSAVGGLFKPYQIVRVARAEAEAERIRAEANIQISDLQRRAFHRWLDEEAKKQRNMEEITRQALPQLDDTSNPRQVEDDWITNFFDKCRLISDSEMQSLWSRILAGEANSPGSFSKRTVNYLSSLDKADAQLFTNLCKFDWWIGEVTPLLYDVEAEVYNKWGINFTSLKHLDSIGLIQFESLAGYRHVNLPKVLNVFYYGTPTVLEFKNEANNDMNIGHVLLTKVGKELAPTCGSQPDAEFQQYILKKWKEMGYINS
ncbi:DUF2806 domain-containing protein [Candidatus Acetothermia bacterium]|jgi:hypothetical protein|nr:DUF2806 domain-containing protein [Candidatus Acetothermia bacterium]